MGNRPQGSKFAYNATATFFALLMGYMLFCSGWLTYKGVVQTLATLQAENEQFGKDFKSTAAAIFTNAIFRNLIVSSVATFGIYMLASLLFFDFLHMFTSFVSFAHWGRPLTEQIQYLLLSPSYINIMNVYAFCNTHDVSWGTKGDNKVSTDLGIVNTGKDNKVSVEVPTDTVDIDNNYLSALQLLGVPEKKVKVKRDTSTKQEDYYRSFRTRVVLLWIITNLAYGLFDFHLF